MLVPSMTLKEIKKEIDRDFPMVFNKVRFLSHKLIRETRPHGSDTVVRFYDYVTKYKNNWIIRIEVKKKKSVFDSMAYYYNNTGLTGIRPVKNENLMTYHTSHFFKRFNERLHLNLTQPKDIICAFLDENERFIEETLENISPGINKIFCTTRKGYILGTRDDNQKFIKMNTFITHDMLKGEQHEIARELNKLLEKYTNNVANLT